MVVLCVVRLSLRSDKVYHQQRLASRYVCTVFEGYFVSLIDRAHLIMPSPSSTRCSS